MDRSNSLVKITLCLVAAFAFNASYAAPGCCSHHGGVKGCNTSTNHQLCKDGTTSPSCACSGTTTKVKKTTVKETTTQPAATPAPAATTTTTQSTTATTEVKKSTKGCCSRHGGVAGCNASGFSTCKDGTVSSTCKC